MAKLLWSEKCAKPTVRKLIKGKLRLSTFLSTNIKPNSICWRFESIGCLPLGERNFILNNRGLWVLFFRCSKIKIEPIKINLSCFVKIQVDWTQKRARNRITCLLSAPNVFVYGLNQKAELNSDLKTRERHEYTFYLGWKINFVFVFSWWYLKVCAS